MVSGLVWLCLIFWLCGGINGGLILGLMVVGLLRIIGCFELFVVLDCVCGLRLALLSVFVVVALVYFRWGWVY